MHTEYASILYEMTVTLECIRSPDREALQHANIWKCELVSVVDDDDDPLQPVFKVLQQGSLHLTRAERERPRCR